MAAYGTFGGFGGFTGGGGGFGGFSGASLALGIGGALSSGIGSFYQAKANKYQLQTQAVIDDTNARISEMGAQSALNQGQKEIANLTLQAGQLKSSQRASMAANGIDLGTGSAAEVQASTDIMKEIDVNQANANTVKNAWGYRMQGVNYQNQSLAARAGASSISPIGSATTSLMSGATQVASNWYTNQRMTYMSDYFNKGGM
jgi:hypothetical protein